MITGYRVDVDPAALGLPVTAFVRVRPAPRQLPKVAELAAKLPEVTECHRISGEGCLLVKVHAASVEDLETTLDKFLLHGQTVTSIVVATPVPPRPLAVEGRQPADGSPTHSRGSPIPRSPEPAAARASNTSSRRKPPKVSTCAIIPP